MAVATARGLNSLLPRRSGTHSRTVGSECKKAKCVCAVRVVSAVIYHTPVCISSDSELLDTCIVNRITFQSCRNRSLNRFIPLSVPLRIPRPPSPVRAVSHSSPIDPPPGIKLKTFLPEGSPEAAIPRATVPSGRGSVSPQTFRPSLPHPARIRAEGHPLTYLRGPDRAHPIERPPAR